MTSGKTSNSNYFKIYIAIAFIAICLGVSIIKNLLITEYILIVIFAFSLAILSFLIVGKISGGANLFGISLKSISGGFMVFVLVIILYFEYSTKTSKREIIEIKNPVDLKIWEKASGHLKFFNAPFAYAGATHFKTKLKWFQDPNFMLTILMFDAKDSLLHTDDFLPKLERLRIFLDSLNTNHVDCKKYIEVKVYTGMNIPTTSFFITSNSVHQTPYSIMYMSRTPKPEECLVSESPTFEKMLEFEFLNFWDHPCSKTLSIKKLLDKNLITNNSADIFY
jgi:hypothetical protein